MRSRAASSSTAIAAPACGSACGKTEQVIEAREVIVCGGAIGSPHLLMLSGIGAAPSSQRSGVEPRHELAGVGKHLEDHLLAFRRARTKPARATALTPARHRVGRCSSTCTKRSGDLARRTGRGAARS